MTSRKRVLRQYNDVVFIEYVDGAGYFSSLNGDLRKLLSMNNTRSFVQIKSIPVRLRRELQTIGFLTTLEIEHAIVQSSGYIEDVKRILLSHGYNKNEIDRAIEQALCNEYIRTNDRVLQISDKRRDIIRQYLLLDILAIHGRSIVPGTTESTSSVLIPGYGQFYGLAMDNLAQLAADNAGILRDEVESSKIFTSDIRILSSRGNILLGR